MADKERAVTLCSIETPKKRAQNTRSPKQVKYHQWRLVVWLLCLILVWILSAGVWQSLLDPALGEGVQYTIERLTRGGGAAERCKWKQFPAEWRGVDRRSGGANSSGFLIMNWNCRSEADQRDGKRETHRKGEWLSIHTDHSVLLHTLEHTACRLYEITGADRGSASENLGHTSQRGSFTSFSESTVHIVMKPQPVCVCVFCSFKQVVVGEEGEEVQSHPCHSGTIPIRTVSINASQLCKPCRQRHSSNQVVSFTCLLNAIVHLLTLKTFSNFFLLYYLMCVQSAFHFSNFHFSNILPTARQKCP